MARRNRHATSLRKASAAPARAVSRASRMPRAGLAPIRWSHARHHRHRLLPPARRAAWGHGLATIAGDGTVLDTWYPSPALGEVGTASALPVDLRMLAGRDERRG